MDKRTEYKRVAGLEVHESDDGLIVFNPSTDKVHHLNYTSGVLFELCHDSHTLEDLTERMNTFYDPESVSEDIVKDGVAQLLKEGVFVTSEND